MYRLALVSLFIYPVIALSDVSKQCIQDNSEPLSNDFLLGSWFNVYRFVPGGTFPASCSCIEDKYTRPTNDIVQQYRDKYNDPGLPYSFDDNPVLKNDSYWQGMVMGNQQAKFYVLTPNTTSLLADGYSVIAYKRLSDKYMMSTECAMRGNFRWLLSRDKNSPIEEMQEIINNTPEFQRLDGQRFCAVDNWCF